MDQWAWPKNISSSFFGLAFLAPIPTYMASSTQPTQPRFHTTTRHSCSDALLCLFASDQAVLLLQRHGRFLDFRLLGLAPRRGMTISPFFEAASNSVAASGEKKKQQLRFLVHFIFMFTSHGISGIFERPERSRCIH